MNDKIVSLSEKRAEEGYRKTAQAAVDAVQAELTQEEFMNLIANEKEFMRVVMEKQESMTTDEDKEKLLKDLLMGVIESVEFEGKN